MAQYKIIIDHTKVSADLTDFPVYIDLANFPADFWDTVSEGGGDIRCYDVLDNELAREVVSCDTTLQSGELYIKANLSSTVGTILKVVVDGVSSDYLPTDTYGSQAVWVDYSTVLHLNSQTIKDSTGTLADKIVTNTIDSAPTGGSVYFDNNSISFGNVLEQTSGTLSAWVKAKAVTGSSGSTTWVGTNGLYIILGNEDPEVIATNRSISHSPWAYNTVSTVESLNEIWARATIVFGTDLKLYVNGTLQGSDSTYTYFDVNRPFMLGGHVDGGGLKQSRGRWVSDVRLTTTTRPPEWISTEYNNQSSPTAFYTIENIIQAPIPHSDGYAYMYENVGYSAPNSGEGYGYSYENVGYSAPNSGEGYGYSYENVGYSAPNSGEGYGYSYENVTLYVIDNDNMLPPVIN